MFSTLFPFWNFSIHFFFFSQLLCMHSKHMDFRRELSNSLHKIINGLEWSDQQTVSLRLEVLYETALTNGDVPLDAIDLIDQARKQLIANQNLQQPFPSYQAPLLNDWGWATRKTQVFDIGATVIVF